MSLRPYFAFLKAYFLVHLAYRVEVVLWFVAHSVELVFVMLLWVAIFASSSVNQIHGFRLMDMLLYQFLMIFTHSLTQTDPLDVVMDDFNDGKIAMSLIKPVNYELQIFFQNLGSNLFQNMIFIGPIAFILFVWNPFPQVGIVLDLSTILLYMFSIIMGLGIQYFVKFMFANLVFYTEASFGLWQLQSIVISILAGSIIPLSFFPEIIANVLRFLPFASMTYTPVMIIMQRIQGETLMLALLLQVIWIIILGFLSHQLWRFSMRRLKVHGG
jgi:ABC-2 type transport system permease protein